jgi:type I restriction enzyme S subunit
MTYQGKYLTKTSKTISKLGLDNSSSWLVPKDSLIYSMYASVGFVSINKIEISTSQAVMNIMLKDSVLTEYMYYFLLDFKRYVSQFIETGTQGNINASIVKNFDIKVPSLKEQTKIANFLSELDSKIEVLSITIENTETFKKGLLQQMFV